MILLSKDGNYSIDISQPANGISKQSYKIKQKGVRSSPGWIVWQADWKAWSFAPKQGNVFDLASLQATTDLVAQMDSRALQYMNS